MFGQSSPARHGQRRVVMGLLAIILVFPIFGGPAHGQPPQHGGYPLTNCEGSLLGEVSGPVQVGQLPSCEFNRLPTASLTYLQLDGTLTVDFDAGDSSDPEGLPLAYEWDFGDGSPPSNAQTVQHTYAAAGWYDVALTVWDDCGDWDVFEFPLEVIDPEPEPFHAEFFIEQLNSVDPITGEEVWQPIQAGEQVERGMRLRFDASGSTGAMYYYYDFGDGSWNTDMYSPFATHTYFASGTYHAVLTVYDQSGMNVDTFPMDITVDTGMRYVGNINCAGLGPIASTVVQSSCGSDYLWAISGDDQLGGCELTDPLNPGSMQLVDVPGGVEFGGSMASYGEYIYVASWSSGVNIFHAPDPVTCSYSGELPMSLLNGQAAAYVAVAGGDLYVGTQDPPVIFVFSLAASPASPTPVKALALPSPASRLEAISTPGEAYVAARVNPSDLVYIVDARNPADPILVQEPVQLPALGTSRLATGGSNCAATHALGTEVITVAAEPGSPLLPRAAETVNKSGKLVVSARRLYFIDSSGCEIRKFNITTLAHPDPNLRDFYAMQVVGTAGSGWGHGVLYHPQGSDEARALYVGGPTNGFAVYVP